jgi:hypothetical protein
MAPLMTMLRLHLPLSVTLAGEMIYSDPLRYQDHIDCQVLVSRLPGTYDLS